MQNRFKVILSNKNLYKEIYLSPDMERITVGTAVNDDIRLRKENFFGPVFLAFTQTADNWNAICSDNLYFNASDVRKLIALKLQHGTEFKVCYQESDNVLFEVSFVIDFDYERKDYNRKIDISGKGEIKIGGVPGADIGLSDEYLGNDAIILKKQGDRLVLTDPGSRYGAYVNGIRISGEKEIREKDFFSIVGFSFYYKDGCLFTSLKQDMQINGLTQSAVDSQSARFVYPNFNRSTRIQYEIAKDAIEIQQPVSKPSFQKKSIIMTILPTLVMLAMTILLRGIIGGGGTFVIYSAVSMGMGVIMSVVTYVQDKKTYKKEVIEREETYQKYIAEKENLIAESRANELRVRRMIYESLENSLKEADSFGKRLFEKGPEDKDFLQIYLGTGRIESANQVQFTKQEFVDMEDPLTLLPEQVATKYRYIEDAPVISDFHASCGIGVVGKREEQKQVLKNMTLDLAIRHFYKEVRLVYILDAECLEEFQWIRWLHNIENESLDVWNIVCDEESRNLLLEDIYSILSGRENILKEAKEYVFEEQYVVLVTDSSAISRHPVSKYIQNCSSLGFTFVFFEDYEENLPKGCTEVIRLSNDGTGHTLKSANGDDIVDFVYPHIPDDAAEKTALKLGAVYVDEVTLEEQLTKNITLFELLGILSAEDLDLDRRWGGSRVYETLAAPIGVKSNKEIVALDISDRADGHGPHGLVAGTTGSGKSEILQTYILSIATLFHPYDVGFVLIDFKGGGMANQFEKLPHLIGTITNIDGREIDRSMLSIGAELVKRQEMFSEAGVNHINDYIRLFKAGKVSRPMPHLIMIVDEFAELKTEYPEFMKELVSTARIGRTLGIHLILATQRPGGVVDPQIDSNSKFRLCLKVQTREDSKEVLKTPLAAEIVEPGRAYFKVENSEIFELIQSAYSGARVPTGSDSNENVYEIYERNLWGKKTLKYTNKKKAEEKSELSQLQAIVSYVGEHCALNNVQKLPGICLPPLEHIISTEKLDYSTDTDEGICVPVGFYDDPEQQRQGMVNLEFSRENVYIIGSAQTGKTVLLQTIAYGIIRKYTPEQVNMYLVDCGSMLLKNFENSAHVGGVVLYNEEEKCKNLFKLLNTVIVERKQILSGKGVGNFASYLEAGYTDMPMIVVMIDNMAAFKEFFPEQTDEINSLSREAQGVGISFIVTSAMTNALNYRTQSNFGRKLALNCNDKSEYSNIFGHCRETPNENPGRGLMMTDKRILEWQIAIFGKSGKEAMRSQELREYIEQRNSFCNTSAVKIPMVPEKLILTEAMRQEPGRFREEGMVPVGMDFSTVDYSLLNMKQTGVFALLGDNERRIQFTRCFLMLLAKNVVFHNVEAIVVDDKQKCLEEAKTYGFVKTYVTDVSEGAEAVSAFYDEMSIREDAENNMDMTTVLLILNNQELFRQICADKSAGKELASAIKRANEVKAFILLAQVENQPVGFNSSEVLKTVRDERQGVLFAPVTDNKLFEVSGRVKADSSFDRSMGYRFENGTYQKLKLFE